MCTKDGAIGAKQGLRVAAILARTELRYKNPEKEIS
jgi:hypothetical protein